jgi:REP element-mobilizing transposase RayT
MARALRITYPGAFYHVSSRGNEQKPIFKFDRDRFKFLEYLESAHFRYDAAIHIYCLMDNHYHLLMETPSGNLPQIMRHINGAYTTYYNLKHRRSGHLFQGRYKALLVEFDSYAQVLSRYIHLNPVRANLVASPESYKWSSYSAYVGDSQPPDWLKRVHILGYFSSRVLEAQKRYREYVESVLKIECENPLKNAVSSTVLGSKEFVDTIRAEHLGNQTVDREIPALKELRLRPSADAIETAVDRVCIGDPKLARNIKVYLNQRHTRVRLKKIGEEFGLGESGVSQVCRRLEKRLINDDGLRRMVSRIETAITLSRVKTPCNTCSLPSCGSAGVHCTVP